MQKQNFKHAKPNNLIKFVKQNPKGVKTNVSPIGGVIILRTLYARETVTKKRSREGTRSVTVTGNYLPNEKN